LTVTAVVCCGWPERAANVSQIVRDMRAGTVSPDTIIVLDNFGDGSTFADLAIGDLHVISGHNWECRGKYIAGLLRFADYYLLNDDDMTVGPKTLERLTETAGTGNYVTANRGVQLPKSRRLSHGVAFDASATDKPTRADLIYGSSAFMSHGAILSMLDAESKLRHKWPVEGDDILAGLANDVLIQPMNGDAAFRWLPDGGVAMGHHPDYFAMRDEFTQDALEALGK
jgi:hypothetical protein